MALKLKLTDGIKNKDYYVCKITLPLKITKRLEALGMISGTKIKILNKKKSAMVVFVRGTRFALGRNIVKNIEISEVLHSDDRFYRESELRKNYSF